MAGIEPRLRTKLAVALYVRGILPFPRRVNSRECLASPSPKLWPSAMFPAIT